MVYMVFYDVLVDFDEKCNLLEIFRKFGFLVYSTNIYDMPVFESK